MKKNISIDTIKKGKIYAQKRCLDKKYGKMKSSVESLQKRIEELEIELAFAQRGL